MSTLHVFLNFTAFVLSFSLVVAPRTTTTLVEKTLFVKLGFGVIAFYLICLLSADQFQGT